MRKFIMFAFCFCLILSGSGLIAPRSASAETDTAGKEAAGPEASPASMESAVEAMREQLASQRRQIEKLQAVLEKQQAELEKAMRIIEAGNTAMRAAAETAVSPALPVSSTPANDPKMDDVEILKGELEAVAGSAAEANQRLGKIESDVAAYKKSNDSKVRQVGNFSFSGDVRVRYEPFFQEGAVTRNRERIRARFHMTGKVSDEISGGLSLATGSLDDPISTNQTLTGFFNRKNFGIDKAFITYKPKALPFLKLEAGKFAYPWYRTPLTFDSDVNPEGFAETLSFDFASSFFKNITFVGFQLPVNETSSGHDSFVLGGQIQTQFRLNSRARLALYGAGININRSDPIAVSLANGSLKPSLPNSNTYRYSASGAVLGYATPFAYLDTILKLEVDTHPRFPTTIQFNFVNNTRGSKERSAYWADVTFGRQREVGDLQFGYSFILIEKDAVIGAWNESDLRSSTNVRNHRISLGYLFKGNFTGQFTAWIGRLNNPWDNVSLVPAGVRGKCSGGFSAACEDPYLKRLQLDVIYKF